MWTWASSSCVVRLRRSFSTCLSCTNQASRRAGAGGAVHCRINAVFRCVLSRMPLAGGRAALLPEVARRDSILRDSCKNAVDAYEGRQSHRASCEGGTFKCLVKHFSFKSCRIPGNKCSLPSASSFLGMRIGSQLWIVAFVPFSMHAVHFAVSSVAFSP